MPKKIRHRPIFTATNNHAKQVGMPPFIKTYFENERHQQFIFVYDSPPTQARSDQGQPVGIILLKSSTARP